MSYRAIEVYSERICAIQVLSSHSVVLTCIGVYMPFFNGSHDQTELYVETLEILQEFLNTYSPDGPVVIMGDFNTPLPQ